MSRLDTRRQRLAAIRSDLAELAVEVELIRVERVLARKYSPDQPREPAGQPGGGRWASGHGGSAGPATMGSLGSHDSPATEEVVTEDGSRVLSLRIRSHPSQDWDEQHTVTAPDGTRTVFEMSGRTQTVRDGETGEVLSRGTLSGDRVEPEAFVQDVRAPRPPGRPKIAALTDAARTLLSVLAGRSGSGDTAIFVAPASEYIPGDGPNDPVIWVGSVDQNELDNACPRNGEVQAILDQSAAEVKAWGNFTGPQDYGNKVHAVAAAKIRALQDPNLVAETSYLLNPMPDVPYGTLGSYRLDALENTIPSTVCVYDHKTGDRGLRPRRAVDIGYMVKKNFPHAKNIILIEVRPR